MQMEGWLQRKDRACGTVYGERPQAGLTTFFRNVDIVSKIIKTISTAVSETQTTVFSLKSCFCHTHFSCLGKMDIGFWVLKCK